jgi:hypothetical protein
LLCFFLSPARRGGRKKTVLKTNEHLQIKKFTTEIHSDFATFRVAATKSGGATKSRQEMKITTEIHSDFAPA